MTPVNLYYLLKSWIMKFYILEGKGGGGPACAVRKEMFAEWHLLKFIIFKKIDDGLEKQCVFTFLHS